MLGSMRARALMWLGGGVFLVLAVHSTQWLAARTPLGEDFWIYVAAAGRARAGLNPYSPYAIGSSFVYHPFALTLVSWALWFEPPKAWILWLLVSGMAFGASLMAGLRIVAQAFQRRAGARVNPRFVVLLFMAFAPLWESFYTGQLNTLVILAVLLCFYFAERNAERSAGACLGVAVALKLSPAILVIYFVATRRYRAVLAAATTLVVVTIVPAVQFHAGVVRDFVTILPSFGSSIFPSRYNQNILGLAYSTARHSGWVNSEGVLLALHKAALAAMVLILAVRAYRTAPLAAAERLWFFVSFLMLAIVFSPLLWYHHSTFLLLPLLPLLARGRGSFALAIGLMLLIQSQRFFEEVVFPAAFPVVAAHLFIAAVAVRACLAPRTLDTLDRIPDPL